jgi:hypothetical protein
MIVKGLHGDSFAVLGPHQVAPSSWEVRAILPRARTVQIIAPQGSLIAPMERRHIDGLFIARFSSDHFVFFGFAEIRPRFPPVAEPASQ